MNWTSISLVPLLALIGCAGSPIDLDAVPEDAVASCVYVNLFSGAEECREYLGETWSVEDAEDDCRGQDDSEFAAGGGCDVEERLGACLFESGEDRIYRVVFPGTDADNCESFRRGCEVFGGGLFVAAEPCGGLPEVDYDQGTGDGVYVQPEQICVEVEGEEACTWSAIGGCNLEGERFEDAGSCADVRSQRGYYPTPPDEFETAPDDPVLEDPAFQADLEWVKGQVESCGCVCCHSAPATPSGPSNWFIEADGVWTDSFRPNGLAMAAGWVDSSLLGAYPMPENNGFDRSATALPTTDPGRMIRFFEGELARRGLSRSDFADAEPQPAVFLNQANFEPSACEAGQGIDTDGLVEWTGGRARYVYVLEADALNPLSPPNLNIPAGTLWLTDVDWRDQPMESGTFRYGEAAAGARQQVPAAGEAPALRSGELYYLYVQADVVEPITRCLFTAP